MRRFSLFYLPINRLATGVSLQTVSSDSNVGQAYVFDYDSGTSTGQIKFNPRYEMYPITAFMTDSGAVGRVISYSVI